MLPIQIENVIEQLSSLQGLGKKGSQKISLELLELSLEDLKKLLENIAIMKNQVKFCTNCGFFSSSTNNQTCSICLKAANNERESKKICIVEKAVDVLNLEKTLIYNGVYHVLENLISPIDNKFITDTKISDLFERRIPKLLTQQTSGNNSTIELILFLKPSFAADATIAYLKDLIIAKNYQNVVFLSQLAQGLPLYYNSDNLDQATMIKALEDRKNL